MKTESAPPNDCEAAYPSGVHSAHAIVEAVVSRFTTEHSNRMTEDACIARLQLLCPALKQFLGRVRITEGFLSAAQVNEGANLEPGTHNYVEHVVAQQNYIHNISGTRISRHAAWAFHLEKVAKLCRVELKNIPADMFPKKFRPSCALGVDDRRAYQIVVYRATGNVMLGLVHEIFRGSNTKGPEANKASGRNKVNAKPTTRLMRCSKPVDIELQATMVSRMKVVTLQQAEQPFCWTTSNLCSGVLMDPLDVNAGVVGEIQVQKVLSSFPRLVVRLQEDVLEVLSAIKDRGQWGRLILQAMFNNVQVSSTFRIILQSFFNSTLMAGIPGNAKQIQDPASMCLRSFS